MRSTFYITRKYFVAFLAFWGEKTSFNLGLKQNNEFTNCSIYSYIY
jgi:hypothetical protein